METSSDNRGNPVNSYAGEGEIAIFKLNNNGALQWNTFYGSMTGDTGIALDLDVNDSI